MKIKQEQYDPMLLQGRDLEIIFNAVADAVAEDGEACLKAVIKDAEGREPTPEELSRVAVMSRTQAQTMGIHISLHLRDKFGMAAGAVESEELIKAYGEIREHFDDHYKGMKNTPPEEYQRSYQASVDYERAIATTLVDKALDYILKK